MTSRRHGFTLIELATVLAIAGLLATLGWQGYQREVAQSRRAEGRAAVLRVLMQQQQRFARLGAYRVFVGGPQEGEFKWHSGARAADAAYLLRAEACDATTDLRRCIRVIAVPARAIWTDPQCGSLRADTLGRRDSEIGGACW